MPLLYDAEDIVESGVFKEARTDLMAGLWDLFVDGVGVRSMRRDRAH